MQFTISTATPFTQPIAWAHTRCYFTEQGFFLVDQNDSRLHFQRGSRWQHLLTFDTLQLKSDIRVEITEQGIALQAEVDTHGRDVLPEEKAVWQELFDTYHTALSAGHTPEKPDGKLRWAAMQVACLLVFQTLGLSMVIGASVAFALRQFGIEPTGFLYGISAGLLYVVVYTYLHQRKLDTAEDQVL